MSAQPAIAADWYADPGDPTQLRWWDGAGWTDHVAPAAAPAAVEAEVVAEPVAEPDVAAAPIEPVAPALAIVPDLPEAFVPEMPAAVIATPPVAFPAADAEVAAAPTQLDAFMEDDATRLAEPTKAKRQLNPKLLILVLAAVVVGGGAWWFTHREPTLVEDPAGVTAPATDGAATGALVGGESEPAPTVPTDPAATAADPAAADPAAADPAAAKPAATPGSDAPAAVNDATGNGIAKAAEVAAGMEARTAAALAAGESAEPLS
ncbi:MAG: hypothetical protein JWM25_429 [Thermoleophilia bacterium]|nr:hypothetical protein [Thermoleophilia bacterium]